MRILGDILLTIAFCTTTACGVIEQLSPDMRLAKAEEDVRNAKDDYWRLLPLGKAAMAAVDTNDLDKATRYANQLLQLSRELFPADRPDDDGIHKGDIVLGRVVLRGGDIKQADAYLLAAAQVKGSPVLGSFGPNMMLAKELLERGERQSVIEYFDLCAKFWKSHPEKLKQWRAEVKAGKMPNLEANLVY